MSKMMNYRLKGKRIYVGLEDAKRTWKVCVRSEGMEVHLTSMPGRWEVLRAYLQNQYPECEVTVMYETGFHGFWLHDVLVAAGMGCVVTPANKVSCPKDDRVKTDRRDARRLAQNLENGDYKVCHVPDRERREDRQVSRTLDQVQKDIKRTKNRIRRLLEFHGLDQDLRPGTWVNADYRRLRDLELSAPLRLSLDIHLNQVDALWEAEDHLKRTLKQLADKPRYRRSVALKTTHPGIGWLSAIRLSLEWGDFARFPSRKQMSGYTGLTASEYSSGATVRRGRITGQSSPIVRSLLIECAWRAIRKDPVLLDTFNRVWFDSGSKKKAVVAVARKLTVRMRAVEMADKPYVIGLVA